MFSLVLSIIGLLGILRVNTKLHFIHAFFCSSILGAFYVYLLLDTLVFNNTGRSSESDQGPMEDWLVLLILSTPFLIIFIIGCHSMYLLDMIYDEERSRK